MLTEVFNALPTKVNKIYLIFFQICVTERQQTDTLGENSIRLTFSQSSFSRRATDLRLEHIKQILKFYYITEYFKRNALVLLTWVTMNTFEIYKLLF